MALTTDASTSLEVDVKIESNGLEIWEMGTACLIGGAGGLHVHLDTPKNDL